MNRRPFAMRDSIHQEFGLRDMCNFIKKTKVHISTIVEVGSFCGEGTRIFVEEFPNSKIMCIDPWAEGYDSKDPASSVDMGAVEKRFDMFAKKHKTVSKYKGVSFDFATLPEFANVSMCYIDGCHTYDAVKKDIQFWLKRCQHVICGHDYGIKNHWLSPVTDAVDELIGKPDAVFKDCSWVKIL